MSIYRLYVEHRGVPCNAPARHFDITWIQFDAGEAATETEGHQPGRAAATKGIQHSAGDRIVAVCTGSRPAHSFGRWERVVMVLARMPTSADIGQHPSADGLRISGAPLPLVVDRMNRGFHDHSAPRYSALPAAAALAGTGLYAGLDQPRGIRGEMGSRVRLGP